jgi:rhodanese-related sulfurtransferase
MTVAELTTDPLEITIAEYLAARPEEPARVIDVREPEEWDAGHLAEATLIPLGELEAHRHEIDPATPVVIVCRSGRRSLLAAEYLRQVGFDRARSLAGGMIAWAAAGQPVER